MHRIKRQTDKGCALFNNSAAPINVAKLTSIAQNGYLKVPYLFE